MITGDLITHDDIYDLNSISDQLMFYFFSARLQVNEGGLHEVVDNYYRT